MHRRNVENATNWLAMILFELDGLFAHIKVCLPTNYLNLFTPQDLYMYIKSAHATAILFNYSELMACV